MSLIPRRSTSINTIDPLADFNEIFSNLFVPMKALSDQDSGWLSPQVDISETEKSMTFKVDLPGVKKDDIHIGFEDKILSITAEREEEEEEKKKGKLVRRERKYGSYQRSFTLANNFLQSDTQAKFKNGVLTLTIPKIEPTPKETMTIDVK